MTFKLYTEYALALDLPKYRLRRGDLVRPVDIIFHLRARRVIRQRSWVQKDRRWLLSRSQLLHWRRCGTMRFLAFEQWPSRRGAEENGWEIPAGSTIGTLRVGAQVVSTSVLPGRY